MEKPEVTVCIPAYNEEQNILNVLNDALKQNQKNYTLKKIIVYSDGSTDKTNQIVSKKKNKKVELIIGKKRKGISKALNVLYSNTNEEILVLLNADIKIHDKNLINKLIKPILDNKADLTSAKMKPASPKNMLEKSLYSSVAFKQMAFESFKNSHNVYTCYGPVRAFSKKFYKSLIFNKGFAGDDMFTYFSCIKAGLRFVHVKRAKAYYKLPHDFRGHKSQSTRFQHSIESLNEYFSECNLVEELKIPLSILFRSFVKTFIKYPFSFTLYIFILAYIRIVGLFELPKKQADKWVMAKTSKSFS